MAYIISGKYNETHPLLDIALTDLSVTGSSVESHRSTCSVCCHPWFLQLGTGHNTDQPFCLEMAYAVKIWDENIILESVKLSCLFHHWKGMFNVFGIWEKRMALWLRRWNASQHLFSYLLLISCVILGKSVIPLGISLPYPQTRLRKKNLSHPQPALHNFSSYMTLNGQNPYLQKPP